MDNQVVEILLVEDSGDDARLTIRSLKKNNLANNLLHVSDGEQALDYLLNQNHKQLPKVILLDLKMPKVDGLEVLRSIKSNDKLKIIPVVVLTSSKEEQDVVESYRLGVNAYIVKPVDFTKFSKAISEIGYFWMVLNQPPA